MFKFSWLYLLLFAGYSAAFAQTNISLLPYVGKGGDEVVLAFNSKTGKSVEWYFDEATKAMAKAPDNFQISNTGISGTVQMKAYIGADGNEVVLAWSPSTGQSISWYYDEATKSMIKSSDGYQLPSNIGLTGNVMMYPYIGADGSEVVLAWETATGKSVSYYFDKAEKKFLKSTVAYQLPATTGVTGKVMMHPYIGKDRSEAILVWDANSGKSVSWYFDEAEKKFKKASEGFQLPANPGVGGSVMMHPYIGNDGSEVILVWSTINGASMMWYYDNLEKRFIKSKSDFQLPTNTGIAQNVMMVPFIVKNNDEVIYIWDAATGKSINFYFNDNERKYIKSGDEYQLPANPLN